MGVFFAIIGFILIWTAWAARNKQKTPKSQETNPWSRGDTALVSVFLFIVGFGVLASLTQPRQENEATRIAPLTESSAPSVPVVPSAPLKQVAAYTPPRPLLVPRQTDVLPVDVRPNVGPPQPITYARVSTHRVRSTRRGGRSGCGSRGGPGYRLANGRCASWRR